MRQEYNRGKIGKLEDIERDTERFRKRETDKQREIDREIHR